MGISIAELTWACSTNLAEQLANHSRVLADPSVLVSMAHTHLPKYYTVASKIFANTKSEITIDKS